LESGAGIEHGLGSIGEVLERLRIPRGQPGVRLGDSFDSAALRDGGVDRRSSLLRAENGGGYGDTPIRLIPHTRLNQCRADSGAEISGYSN
jgi:hypothetical protein